jgi:hypothetical protein
MAAGLDRLQVQESCRALPTFQPDAIAQAPVVDRGFSYDAEKNYAPVMVTSPLPPRGVNWFDLLKRQLVLSADNANPLEIDDGIFVDELPTSTETYRVGTCVPDIADLVADPKLRKRMIKKVEARYGDMQGGKQAHDPLIPEEYVRQRELKEGEVRGAMIVSFLIGANHPPSDVRVSFEEVMAVENTDYQAFSKLCRPEQRLERFANAAQLIVQHLGYRSGLPKGGGLLHGSRIIEAYNVAPNHLVGKMIAEEGIWPGVYRRREVGHGQRSEVPEGVFPPGMAYYSEVPGMHAGFKLDPICRISSPLRRLNDAWMNYILKQRHLDLEPTPQDFTDNAAIAQRLNEHRLRQSISTARVRVA